MKNKTEQLDRPAPEADAAERMAWAGEYMVPTEVARRLERERDEAREALKEFQPLEHHYCSFNLDVVGDCILCKKDATK